MFLHINRYSVFLKGTTFAVATSFQIMSKNSMTRGIYVTLTVVATHIQSDELFFVSMIA